MHRNEQCQWWIDRCPAWNQHRSNKIRFQLNIYVLCRTSTLHHAITYFHTYIYLFCAWRFSTRTSLFLSSYIFIFSWKKKSRFNVTKCEWKTEKPVNFTTHAFTYPPSESEKFCPAHFFFSVKEDEFSSRS